MDDVTKIAMLLGQMQETDKSYRRDEIQKEILSITRRMAKDAEPERKRREDRMDDYI